MALVLLSIQEDQGYHFVRQNPERQETQDNLKDNVQFIMHSNNKNSSNLAFPVVLEFQEVQYFLEPLANLEALEDLAIQADQANLYKIVFQEFR